MDLKSKDFIYGTLAIVATFAIVLSLTSLAKAQDLSFKPYISAGAGHVTSADTLDVNVDGFGTLLGFDSSRQGYQGNVRAGGDVFYGQFFAGLFAGYNFGSADGDVLTIVPAFVGSVNIELTPTLELGARAGIKSTNNWLLFVGAGMFKTEVHVSTDAFGLGTLYKDEKWGKMVFAGFEAPITPILSFGADYTLKMVEVDDLCKAGCAPVSIPYDASDHVVMGRLILRPFN